MRLVSSARAPLHLAALEWALAVAFFLVLVLCGTTATLLPEWLWRAQALMAVH